MKRFITIILAVVTLLSVSREISAQIRVACVGNSITYGTGTDDKGNPSKGKACKNMRRIYLLMDNDPNFYLLSVPPTSIKDVNKQLAKMTA